MKEDRQVAIQESRLLLDCLYALHPGWKQKDVATALHISKSFVSEVQSDKPDKQKPFSAPVRELARYKTVEALDELTGHQHSLSDLKSMAGVLIDCCRTHGVEEVEKLLSNVEELYAKGGVFV